MEALLWFIELDTPEPVIDDMIPFLSHKIPKLVAGTAASLTEVFKVFGANTVSPKPVVKLIPKLFSHADKNVRKEATSLAVELYKWLGEGFKSAILPDLKPVQQKELTEEFDKVKDQTPHQERYLRSQRTAMERQQLSGFSASENSSGDGDKDADNDSSLDLIEAVEVSSKIPPGFDSRLSSTKWKERKEALEELFPIVNVPKISPDDYNDLMRLFAKCMKDANIQVVSLAGNCIEAFAKGLRSDFNRYVPVVLSPMLERLKEKKVAVTDALTSALDALFKTSSLSEILEEILTFMGHKTPQVKIETSKFLSRCLSTTKTMPKPAEIKSIVGASIKILGDTQEPVRSAAAEVLGVVMKLIGERAMTPHLEGVDDIKKGKIMEFYNTAEIKAKSVSKPSVVEKPTLGGTAKKRPSPSAPRTSNTRTRLENGSALSQTKPKSLEKPSTSVSSPTKTRPELKSESSNGSVQSLQRPGAVGRGLTNRSLASGRAPPPVDNGLSAAEKAEFEQLKLQKLEWEKEKEAAKWQKQEDATEKARLMQEINDLQVKNSQLADDHTRDVLSIKSKDTQLIRAKSDIDTLRQQVASLEQELEIVKSKPANGNMKAPVVDRLPPPLSPTKLNQTSPRRMRHSVQGTSGTPTTDSVGASNAELADSAPRPAGTRHTMAFQESSLSSSKENQGGAGALPRYQARNSLAPGSGDKPSGIPAFSGIKRQLEEHTGGNGPNLSMATNNNDNRNSNWKRAAEVTVQLKARIEAMKARQNQNRAAH